MRASSPQGRFAASAAVIDNTTMTAAWAWGKHLFLEFDRPGENVVHVHLGLYGSWRFSGAPSFAVPSHIGAPRVAQEHFAENVKIAPEDGWMLPEPRGQVRLRLIFDDGVADLTGPAACELMDRSGVAGVLARLGPDPLRPDCDPERFVAACRASGRPVGQLVMDQGVVAGPGNIYRAECLFRVGISPLRPGKRVSADRLRALYADLAQTMADGLERGQIVTVRPEDVPDPLTDAEAARFYVYHRAGRPCLSCGRTVLMEPMAGRKLYRCATCQR